MAVRDQGHVAARHGARRVGRGPDLAAVNLHTGTADLDQFAGESDHPLDDAALGQSGVGQHHERAPPRPSLADRPGDGREGDDDVAALQCRLHAVPVDAAQPSGRRPGDERHGHDHPGDGHPGHDHAATAVADLVPERKGAAGAASSGGTIVGRIQPTTTEESTVREPTARFATATGGSRLRSVSAHCDIPCGVYDPEQARIEAESCLKIINKYHDSDDELFRARCVHVKEQRAELAKHHIDVLWSDWYKPAEMGSEHHSLFNQAVKACSDVKRSMDAEPAEQLLALIDQIDQLWKSNDGPASTRVNGRPG